MDILLKKTHKKNHGGDSFYTVPGSHFYTYEDIHDHLKIGDIEFENVESEQVLISVLHRKEINHQNHTKIDRTVKGDIRMLERIISSGGFVKYIERLEGMKQ